MKRSYDLSSVHNHTAATNSRSFTSQNLTLNATQAAPSPISSSIVSNLFFDYDDTRAGLMPSLDLCPLPLLTTTPEFSGEDFQCNAATPNAVIPPPTDSYLDFPYGSGASGLGITYLGDDNTISTDNPAYGSTEGTKHEKPEVLVDILGKFASPLPGGLLELLTQPSDHGELGHVYVADDAGRGAGSNVLTGTKPIEEGPSCWFRSNAPSLSPSVASLFYASGSEGSVDGSLFPSIPSLFYPSGSEHSMEGSLMAMDLLYPSSPEVSFQGHSFAASLPSSSSAVHSIQKSLSLSSARDPLRTLLDLYSPRPGSGTVVASSFIKQEPIVGLVADVNLRALPTRSDEPHLYVNPAEIMGEEGTQLKAEEQGVAEDIFVNYGSQDFMVIEDEPMRVSVPPADSVMVPGFTHEAVQAIVSVLSAADREHQEQEMSKQSEPSQPAIVPEEVAHANTAHPVQFQLLGIPLPCLPLPMSFPQGTSYPLLQPSGLSSGTYMDLASTDHTTALDLAPYSFSFRTPSLDSSHPSSRIPLLDRQAAYAAPIDVVAASAAAQENIHYPARICNAHLGVDLFELRQQADDFRRMNPGLDLDKTWLQNFAGKLSVEGELIDEWRCYVRGCSQRNRRRDHILVHVGSHVEHRPFSCSRCGMRFLRKNECKRHEASHDGAKPFECAICAPVQHRSFARQDLLRRHMRVTHGVVSQTAIERRKRLKVDHDGEYVPGGR